MNNESKKKNPTARRMGAEYMDENVTPHSLPDAYLPQTHTRPLLKTLPSYEKKHTACKMGILWEGDRLI